MLQKQVIFYQILYLYSGVGPNSLKKMITSYSDDVLVFVKKTTVQQLMNVWPGQREVPPSFSKLRARIAENPSKYTLYELDQLRKRFCSEIKFTDIVFVLIGLEISNSFIAEWLIPSALVLQLIDSIRELHFRFYPILKMTVDERQIFPFVPDSKQKVATLPALTTMVTVSIALQCLWCSPHI